MEISTDGPVVALEGDFDVRSTATVRLALYRLLDRYDAVVVDLSEVRSVDVTALRVLAAASRSASAGGGRLRLRGCNGSVRRLLHLTHLIRVLDVERASVLA